MNAPLSKAERQSIAARSRAKLEQARKAGLMGEEKDARIAGRVSAKLVRAAKKRAGTASDTEVVEIALATLALEDDFAERLLRRKGSVPKDIDLDF
jgi:hypothetical protein